MSKQRDVPNQRLLTPQSKQFQSASVFLKRMKQMSPTQRIFAEALSPPRKTKLKKSGKHKGLKLNIPVPPPPPALQEDDINFHNLEASTVQTPDFPFLKNLIDQGSGFKKQFSKETKSHIDLRLTEVQNQSTERKRPISIFRRSPLRVQSSPGTACSPSPQRYIVHSKNIETDSKFSQELRTENSPYDTPMLPKFQKDNRTKCFLKKGKNKSKKTLYPLKGKVKSQKLATPAGNSNQISFQDTRLSQGFIKLIPTPNDSGSVNQSFGPDSKIAGMTSPPQQRPLILGSEGFSKFFERAKENKAPSRLKLNLNLNEELARLNQIETYAPARPVNYAKYKFRERAVITPSQHLVRKFVRYHETSLGKRIIPDSRQQQVRSQSQLNHHYYPEGISLTEPQQEDKGVKYLQRSAVSSINLRPQTSKGYIAEHLQLPGREGRSQCVIRVQHNHPHNELTRLPSIVTKRTSIVDEGKENGAVNPIVLKQYPNTDLPSPVAKGHVLIEPSELKNYGYFPTSRNVTHSTLVPIASTPLPRVNSRSPGVRVVLPYSEEATQTITSIRSSLNMREEIPHSKEMYNFLPQERKRKVEGKSLQMMQQQSGLQSYSGHHTPKFQSNKAPIHYY